MGLKSTGLNWKESNDFIVYWLPSLKRNKFSLIRFLGALTLFVKVVCILSVCLCYASYEVSGVILVHCFVFLACVLHAVMVKFTSVSSTNGHEIVEKDYTDDVALDITPKPDTIIRVFMVFKV